MDYLKDAYKAFYVKYGLLMAIKQRGQLTVRPLPIRLG